MKMIKTLLTLVWKAWFAFITFLGVLLVVIPIPLSLIKSSWYPTTWQIMRFWGKFVFYGSGMRLKVHGNLKQLPNEPCVFIANHYSLMDIMVMMTIVKKHPVMFVGKKELDKYPIFGFLYRKTNILVDRSSKKSRMQVFRAANQMAKQGRSLIIFPEGGVPDDESILLDSFKDGAFSIAILNDMPLVVFTFFGLKEMFPYSYTRGYPGCVDVFLEKVIPTRDLSSKDKTDVKKECYDIIHQRLTNNYKNKA